MGLDESEEEEEDRNENESEMNGECARKLGARCRVGRNSRANFHISKRAPPALTVAPPDERPAPSARLEPAARCKFLPATKWGKSATKDRDLIWGRFCCFARQRGWMGQLLQQPID